MSASDGSPKAREPAGMNAADRLERPPRWNRAFRGGHHHEKEFFELKTGNSANLDMVTNGLATTTVVSVQ